MEIPKLTAGLLIQLWSILSFLTRSKVNTSKNMSLVKISMLSIYAAAFLGKKNVVLPQSLGEPECLAKKFQFSQWAIYNYFY